MTLVISPDIVLALLEAPGEAAGWDAVLADNAVFEAVGETLGGREAVAARLVRNEPHPLAWKRRDDGDWVFEATPVPGSGGRGRIVSLAVENGRIVRVLQQNAPLAPVPAAPLKLDEPLKARFNGALAGKHPMSLAYVDADGRPHLSLRGSLKTFGDDALALWVRNPATGLALAVRANPAVALLYRNEETRSTYQIEGRARVADDEATREVVFSAAPAIEQAHDFARLGVAVVIHLDRVEGYAGLGPGGQIDPVRLLRKID